MIRFLMIRFFMRNAFAAGAIGAGLSWSAGLPAAVFAADVAMQSARPVQSNASTASSGRRPLAVRIAMADKAKAPVPATVPVARISGSGADLSPGLTPEVTGAADAERPAVPRLMIDCEESSIDALHGETIRWRITIRNAGAAAHHVVSTLYFAKGIEPTAAQGHDHSLASGEARFSPVETLGPDDSIELEVTGQAVQPGAVAYRIEVGCRELPGHVAREAVILIRPKSRE